MIALVLERYGGPDHVVFADVPRPVPKADEILVQVHAVGLNPIDPGPSGERGSSTSGTRPSSCARAAANCPR
jgi:hypothetical protein